MDIFSALNFLGGLSLFLYGMNVMGESLEKQSGSKFKNILKSLTSSPVKGLLLGIAVTALVQSSSATTVMVVGFVNSGIMKLSQSIGIIMGANIGTTVTSWLLSLTGIKGDNLFLKLLKPTSFSPVFAAIGIFLFIFSKSTKKKDIGTILLGFAILMFGMNIMSESVKPLADVPKFTSILTLFSNPVLGVLAGAFLTAIIQSSSASVGILQALSATGKITFGSAIPLITGQNIGTCVTAVISSIGTNKNAKRAAVIHLAFNIIGTFLFLILFYILNNLINFTFVKSPVTPAQIAIVHTVFNIFATAVLFPFNGFLEKIAYIIVKDKNKHEENQLLDERFLSTPSIAIARSKELTKEMALISKKMISKALSMVDNFDKAEAQILAEMEEKTDIYEDKLGSYLVKLSEKSLSTEDGHEISKLLHSIGDFERISDHAVNIYEIAEEIHEKQINFTNNAINEIKIISEAIREITHMAVEAFITDDTTLATYVEPLEEVIDHLNVKLRANHILRLTKGECTIESGFIFSDLITDLERVADHCSNIAVCLIQISHDNLDMHQYLNGIKKFGDNKFREQYDKFLKKYKLNP